MNCDRPAAMTASLPSAETDTRRRLQGPDDVGRQAGRHHAHPVGDAVDGGLDLDGEVEVAAGQLEQVAGHFHAHPGQSGQGAAPGGGGPGGGAECLDEGVAFGAKLHWIDSPAVSSFICRK